MRILGFFAVVLLVLAVCAQGPPSDGPVPYIPPQASARMFAAYCASCHGTHGRGNGPAARHLHTPPADLTTISVRTHGRFPEEYVYFTIEGESAYGVLSREMPAWAPIFRPMDHNDAQTRMRIGGLTRYVESIQGR